MGCNCQLGRNKKREPMLISSTLSRDDFFFLGAFLKMTMMVGTMTQCRDDGGNGDGDDDDDIVNIVSR